MKQRFNNGRRRFSWVNREDDLKKVERYHTLQVMFYRTNLLTHSLRVQGILQKLIPEVMTVYPNFNPELAILISKFHDDQEMVNGDVPLQMKLLMNGSELHRLKQGDIAAAEYLSRCYGNPQIGKYRYLDLLMHAILKDCPEAQLHSFADKLDGYGEAIHEVLAGNMGFLEAVINYIAKTFSDLSGHYPLIKVAFDPSVKFFHFPVVDLKPYFQYGNLGAFFHTPETIMENKTGILHYELWKEVTLSLPGGMELLTEQKEFHLP